MNRMIKVAAVLLSLSIIGMSPISVLAAEEATEQETEQVQQVTTAEFVILDESDETGYHYSWRDYGTFYSVVKEGEAAAVAYFEFSDSSISYQLVKDGAPYSYNEGDVIFEPGSYELQLYSMDGHSAVFRFTISEGALNSYMESELSSDSVQTVEQQDSFSGFDLSGGLDSFGMEEMEVLTSCSFSAERNELVYSFMGKPILYTNIPDQGITRGKLILEAPRDVSMYVYLNGGVIQQTNNNIYEESGLYHVNIVYYTDANVSADNQYGYCSSDLYFRIMGENEQPEGLVNAPRNFVIETAECSGRAVAVTAGRTCFLDRDGAYYFRFRSTEDGNLSYELRFTRDTTAPFLYFNADISEQKVNPPVGFMPLEPGTKISVRRNMQDIQLANNELNKEGLYYITVEDSFGNARQYTVRIAKVGGVTPLKVLAGMGIVLLGLCVVGLIKRGSYNIT